MTGVPGKRATTKTETSRYDEAELALGFTGTTASAEERPQRAVKILASDSAKPKKFRSFLTRLFTVCK